MNYHIFHLLNFSHIIFDNGNIDCVAKWIHRKKPNIRIIVWYWGPVELCISPKLFNLDYCELWSFDNRDCENYNFKFNTQFFLTQHLKYIEYVDNPVYDVVFVGTEKNRLDYILSCQSQFEEAGLSCYFHVVKSKKHYESKKDYPYKDAMEYSEMLSVISRSRALIDIVSSDQTGMTLRPLEALFLMKKLITNDKSIKEYDIYNHNNIFILDEDDVKTLPDFVNSDYDTTNYVDLIKKYAFEAWVERFFVQAKESL